MSRTRFRNILKHMCFDNRATRADRQATDKLAAFRDIWTMFVAKLPKYYIPGTDLCVDEQLVAFRGRCGFRQYIPSKPAKYGKKGAAEAPAKHKRCSFCPHNTDRKVSHFCGICNKPVCPDHSQ